MSTVETHPHLCHPFNVDDLPAYVREANERRPLYTAKEGGKRVLWTMDAHERLVPDTKRQRVWLERPGGARELLRQRGDEWFTDQEYREHLIRKRKDRTDVT